MHSGTSLSTALLVAAASLPLTLTVAKPFPQFDIPEPTDPVDVGVDAADTIPKDGTNDTTYDWTFNGLKLSVECKASGAQEIAPGDDRTTLSNGWGSYKALTANSGGPYLPNAQPSSNIMYFHTDNTMGNVPDKNEEGHNYCDSCIMPNIQSGMNDIWCQVDLGGYDGVITDCMSNSKGKCQGDI